MKTRSYTVFAILLAVALSCEKHDSPDPLSSMSMAIIPDCADGSVKCNLEPFLMGEEGSFPLRIEITPSDYSGKFYNDGKFVYRASFRNVTAGSAVAGRDFFVDGTVRKYKEDDFMTALFPLSSEVMGKLMVGSYTVSFSISDVEGTKGASTAFVPVLCNRIPKGAVSGVFTVADPDGITGSGDETKVHFSRGNLKYVKGTGWNDGTWEFFEHQYDCDPGTGHTYSPDYISLFTWGYDPKNSINPDDDSSTNSTVTAAKRKFLDTEDWGYAYCQSKRIRVQHAWRTLTIDEWRYLFGNRGPRSDNFRYGVTVMGHPCCVVLYPDDYTGMKVDNGDTSSFDSENEYNAANDAGIVFLPAAGYRNVSYVNSVDHDGEYWSSTSSGEFDAYLLDFYSENVGTNYESNRFFGYSVRLVIDCYEI